MTVHADFFVIRTPLLSFDTFEQWGRSLIAPAASSDALADAIASDRVQLRRYLREVFEQPHVREAMYIASPTLLARIPKWVADPDSQEGQKIERALTLYLSRMCSRCTPFGLFAGCSVGTIGAATRLKLAPRTSYRRHVRPDFAYLSSVVAGLHHHPVWNDFRYRPNATAYERGGNLHYVATVAQEQKATYHEESAVLDEALALSLNGSQGGVTPLELATLLTRELPNVTPEEAHGYVAELIGTQILEPDTLLPVTGVEPLTHLQRVLPTTLQGATILKELSATAEALANLNASQLGVDLDCYRSIDARLSMLPSATLATGQRFQVDLVKPTEHAELGCLVLPELLRGVEVLRRLADTVDPLERFKADFAERYGPGEVPLMEVVDEETGLWRTGDSMYRNASDAPLLKHIWMEGTPQAPVAWGAREDLLLRWAMRGQKDPRSEVAIDLEMLEPLERTALPLPDSFAAAVVLYGSAQDVVEGRGRIFLQGFRGPSGAKVLGRFCHADSQMRAKVECHLRSEEALRKHAVFAEVVYLPEGRLANIALRPVLREYEITYFGKSGAPRERQIPVSDLLVSVIDDRVVLRSRRLDQQVIPSFTNALSSSQSPPGYSFMEHVASQGVCRLAGFRWYPFHKLPFLPRVTTGRVVLSPAQWTLARADIDALQQPSAVCRYRVMAALRLERAIPRYVYLLAGDTRVAVDLDNVLSVDAFVHSIRTEQEVRVAELLDASNGLCVTGPEGRFIHEMVLPLINQRADAAVRARRHQVAVTPRFLPGSNWFYVKVYGISSLLDQLAVSIIPPLLSDLRRAHLISRWFFIRYSDPDWHLRIRFRASESTFGVDALSLLEKIVQPLQESGVVRKVEVATYEPEVNRYGGLDGLDLAETIFEADSDSVLEILQAAQRQADDVNWRWQLALCSLDRLLADFRLPLAERLSLVRRVAAGYSKGVRGYPTLSRQLDDKFRQQRGTIERLLGGQEALGELASGMASLSRRSQRVSAIAPKVWQLEFPRDEWLMSVIHMNANRLLDFRAGVHELVLAALLARFYESRLARNELAVSRRLSEERSLNALHEDAHYGDR